MRTDTELIGELARKMTAEADRIATEMAEEIGRLAPELVADPALARETELSTRANLSRWLRTIATDPERAPPTDPPPEARQLAVSVTRRGMDSAPLIASYRAGQNVALLRWTQLAGELIADREQLLRVLTSTQVRMSSFVDQVLAGVLAHAQHERDALLAVGAGPRVETVRLLLEGAPLDPDTAATRLGYPLADRDHTALFLWSVGDGDEGAGGGLEQTATALAAAAGAARPLTMPAGGGLVWSWLPTLPGRGLDVGAMRRAMSSLLDGHRVVVGPTRSGVEGFRSSHRALADAHRSMDLEGERGRPLIEWAELRVVALAGRDPIAVAEFVASVLGELAGAGGRRARLRETLRAYLQEGSNAPAAAERLHLHRNTVLNRVARAGELIGSDPADNRLAVMLALELSHRSLWARRWEAGGDSDK